jgi:Domain of unknown function (DUF4276)
VIYLCAGIFAEGTTDHHFLAPLLERLLELIGNEEFPAQVNVAAPIIIGKPNVPKKTAAEAILRFWDSCTLFIVHADTGGDQEKASRLHIEPSIIEVKKKYPKALIVSCMPEREVEAWLLADPKVFSHLVTGWKPTLPIDPEKVFDPKKELDRILHEKKYKRGEVYQFFGEHIELDALRRLESFRCFEAELREAIRSLGGAL